MAFSGSSYFFGIGTAFAAIAVGFAGGTMITTSTVQPPNRLERVNASAGATTSSAASSGAEQANAAKPAPQDAPPSPVVAAAPSAPAADSQTPPQAQAAAPAAAKTDAAANVQERAAPAAAAKNSAPAPIARSDDAASAKNERTTVGRAPDPNRDVSRSADLSRETPRKRADDRKPSDDRKFSDRRRRDQDERRLDEATNVVRQMPRGNAVDEIVERDDAPRFRMRPRHFEVYGDDDAPRVVNEPPPRFGLFGDSTPSLRQIIERHAAQSERQIGLVVQRRDHLAYR